MNESAFGAAAPKLAPKPRPSPPGPRPPSPRETDSCTWAVVGFAARVATRSRKSPRDKKPSWLESNCAKSRPTSAAFEQPTCLIAHARWGEGGRLPISKSAKPNQIINLPYSSGGCRQKHHQGLGSQSRRERDHARGTLQGFAQAARSLRTHAPNLAFEVAGRLALPLGKERLELGPAQMPVAVGVEPFEPRPRVEGSREGQLARCGRGAGAVILRPALERRARHRPRRRLHRLPTSSRPPEPLKFLYCQDISHTCHSFFKFNFVIYPNLLV